MQIQDNGLFTSWVMIPEEEERGYQFNTEQRAVMQNLRAAAAEELVKNAVTPITGSDLDMNLRAKLAGQISVLDLLLAGDPVKDPTPDSPTNQESI